MKSFGWGPLQQDWCSNRRTFGQGCIHTGRRLRAQREGPARPRGERPQEKPDLPTPWLWTLSLQNCETGTFCCLSPGPAVLLGQAQRADMGTKAACLEHSCGPPSPSRTWKLPGMALAWHSFLMLQVISFFFFLIGNYQLVTLLCW